MPGALVLTAHGDDMEFFAGGTIALLCERGWDVDVLIATDNSRGTFELTAEQMFGLRLKEADAAAKVLGVRSVSCLDYPDGFLCETPHTTLRGQFMEAIRRHRPGIVFTWDPWAPYENHPDHRAVSWAAMEAASFAHFPLYYPEQLAAWSRAEARAVLFSAHLAKKGAFDENDELRGGLISAVNAAETAASKARIALGLTPASEAAIAKARAETASIVGVNLQSLADAGAAILAERGLHVIEGGAEAAG